VKIFLVAPKSISKHMGTDKDFRFDYSFWNFYFPLKALGHEVTFVDTSIAGDKELANLVEAKKPDLLFCMMTGDAGYCPREPWETIARETEKGRLRTFNWFCDDSWRFESFSSKVCKLFHVCSTPEKRFLNKYEEIGYSNIVEATWHACEDFYSAIPAPKHPRVAFVGNPAGDRAAFLAALRSADVPIIHPKNVSFEDLAYTYASSLIGINFSKNAANGQPQMKGRMFEVPAARSLLVTEYTPGIEEYFTLDKEIICFKTGAEMNEKIKFLLKNVTIAEKIAERGHERYIKEHTSEVRLAKTLEKIFK
jgi:spore maturation protein CgeB